MRKKMLLAALCFTAMANAQSFRFGPAASVEFNKPSGGNKSMVGFNAGVRGEMDFNDVSKGLFLDASVLFDAKNWKNDGYYAADTKLSYEWKYNTYGLTIPVNIGYKVPVSKSVSLLAAAGPYVNFGFGGKCKVKSTSAADGSRAIANSTGTTGKTEQTVTDKTTTASSNVYSDKLMNRFSWGLGFKVGAEFCRHYQVNVGYELGLSDIFKNSLDGKHRTLTIGVAYMF